MFTDCRLCRINNLRKNIFQTLFNDLRTSRKIDDQGFTPDTCCSSRQHCPFSGPCHKKTHRLSDPRNLLIDHCLCRFRNTVLFSASDPTDRKDQICHLCIRDLRKDLADNLPVIWYRLYKLCLEADLIEHSSHDWRTRIILLFSVYHGVC